MDREKLRFAYFHSTNGLEQIERKKKKDAIVKLRATAGKSYLQKVHEMPKSQIKKYNQIQCDKTNN